MDFKYTQAASGVSGAAILRVRGYDLSPTASGAILDTPVKAEVLKKTGGGGALTASDKKYGEIFLNSLAFAIRNVILPEEPIEAVIRVGFDKDAGTGLFVKPVALKRNGLSFFFLFNVGGTPADKAKVTKSDLTKSLADFFLVLDAAFDLGESIDEFLAAFFMAYPSP